MTKTRLNKFANNIQKENIVYVSQMGFSVHAQGPYKHLMPGNPDFFLKKKKKKVQGQCFSATPSASKFFLKSSVGRRWNESFSFDGEGTVEMSSSPFLSPLHSLLVSFPLSSGSERQRLPLFTPQCWQTGQTSWVGPWCQWVGTAAEVKRKWGGRMKTTVISWQKLHFCYFGFNVSIII